MSKRDEIKHKKTFYAVREKDGKFSDITNIGKSIDEDKKVNAEKTVKPGHGHEGDLKK